MSTTDRRQTILQAMLALSAEKGLAGTTIALIAKHAQASPGIIYHYFASKDEIVHTLYRTIEQEFGAYVVTEALFTLSPLERIKEVWLKTFHYYVLHPEQVSFMEQYKSSAYYVMEKDKKVESEPLGRLAEALNRDIAQGFIKNYSFQVMYTLTVGVAVTLAKQQVAGVVDLDEEMLASIAETCCRSLMV